MAIKNPVLVTGGAGYIGTHVCHELNVRGYTPVVIDNLSTGNLQQLQKVCHLFSKDVDVFDKGQISEAFAYWHQVAGPFHAVIHLAAKTSVPEGEKNPYEYFCTNGMGTLNIARLCDEYKVPALIYASTAAVYGGVKVPCEEWHETRPANIYGETKLLGEKCIRGYYGGRSLILRFFNVAGACPEFGLGDTREPTALIPSIVKAAYEGSEFKLYGDGRIVRDFIHVHDLARTIALSVNDKKAKGVFNISGGVASDIQSVIDHTKAIHPELNVVRYEPRSGDVSYSRASIRKISHILAYHPTKTLCDMILSEYAWRHVLSSRSV